jgi:SAM-dependent methyltransferase
MRDPDFYDQSYFDAPGKSNYCCYTHESSPFESHADTLLQLMAVQDLHGPVLDVGCAKGYLVSALRKRGIAAYGADWSEYALANAGPDARPHLRLASAAQLPFPDQQFAVAASFDLLEHLDETHAELALKECARVSAYQLHQVNTGRLPDWAYDGDQSHCLKRSLTQWRTLALRLGLDRTLICEPDRHHPLLDQPSH